MVARKETPVGTKYFRLTTIGKPYKKDGDKRYSVDVLCDCGVIKTIPERRFSQHKVKSCGCLRSETTASRSRSHGMYGTPTYTSWNLMKQRCDDSNSKSYKDYGERGITYDPRWKFFENFLEDMGEKPEGTTLDRIDVNKNYYKENCRWVSRDVQNHNKRKLVGVSGKKVTSRFHGVSYNKETHKWVAKLSRNNKVSLFSTFDSEIEAAIAYDNESYKIYKDRPNNNLIKKVRNDHRSNCRSADQSSNNAD